MIAEHGPGTPITPRALLWTDYALGNIHDDTSSIKSPSAPPGLPRVRETTRRGKPSGSLSE
jgi:hypothetical protein